MNYITTPNLPTKNVKLVILDAKAVKAAEELKKLGINTLITKSIKTFDKYISTHPDMQICHIGENKFFFTSLTENYYMEKIGNFVKENQLKDLKNTFVYNLTEKKLLYPEDCKLNSCISNEWIITHKKNTLFDCLNKKIIKVNQGYSKCSIAVVSNNAIITSDSGIEKAAIQNGIDVCKVTNECIKLYGYKNGFIGGCCGKISKDILAFNGNVKLHPQHDKIISFCKNYNVECLSLSGDMLEDIGSILPLIEN